MVCAITTKPQPLKLSAEQEQELEKFRRSRTEEERGIQHAAILLDAAGGMSDGRRLPGVTESAVIRLLDMFASSFSLGWKQRWRNFRGR
jgi:hypothetical protein